jgi:hypothetical protein
MRSTSIVLISVVALLAAARPSLAHHSFAAEFDGTKLVTLNGTVTKVDWRNPHIWVYLDAKEPDGSVTPWQCEGGAPNALIRQGWQHDMLKPGDQISIDGYRAKDGTNTCNTKTWRLPNGKTIFGGSAGAPAAQRPPGQ